MTEGEVMQRGRWKKGKVQKLLFQLLHALLLFRSHKSCNFNFCTLPPTKNPTPAQRRSGFFNFQPARRLVRGRYLMPDSTTP